MAWPCTGFSFLEGLSMRTPTLILAFCGLLSAPALAQSPASRPASTPTRGMVVFGTLEQDLAKALVAGRGGDADKLLAADFEQRDAAAPEQPLPRAEWLASQQAGEALPAMSQMTVHDFGSLAVVSFISSIVSPLLLTSRDFFLVDVWRNEGGHWQLQVRYQAPAPPQPNEPKPTGKE